MIKVLIVEDDPMVAEFNKRYLKQVGGFELIAITRSFDEALAVLQDEKIDLVLLDIFMPGMSGLDLLAQIRKAGKEIDVIIVSAACDIQTIKKTLQYGAVDYLIKPFEFERFNTALTAYKETHTFMRDKDALNQEELDKLILVNKDQTQALTQIPKGLDKNTLRKVWTNIKEMKENIFSTGEMARNVGISRVSMKKYLDFLSEIGILKREAVYGSVGRPIYKYMCINSETDTINRYL
ncbi:response regulator [Clostridium magnum]|uniref:Transcriptional regulatory protein n=1 Tax=Clostridium magnum DSM 2767 TaxID=1121326 RepID=A0A162R7W5_9CLOT|nr:response regulator [Clostridium magnum]KZL89553.1 transcriptional regulatory protein DcuR [Clostridium magnum DSM 2767]SHH72232.1 two-component system, CitB family, response regulator MalR [Clostridium magnum DSM 2767]